MNSTDKVEYHLTILGAGTSTGVPKRFNAWYVCDPSVKQNFRRRAALLVEKVITCSINNTQRRTTILIDTGPDIRAQLYKARVEKLDAVFYSHAHADHIHGIDDLRAFSLQDKDKKAKLKVYGHKATVTYMYKNFSYCFTDSMDGLYTAILEPHEIAGEDKVVVNGDAGSIVVEPILQLHGSIYSLGFRINNIAYCVDLHEFGAKAAKQLSNLDLFIIEALQNNKHVSHLSLEEAINYIQSNNAKHGIVTALGGQLDYMTLLNELPSNIKPAYDGMKIIVDSTGSVKI